MNLKNYFSIFIAGVFFCSCGQSFNSNTSDDLLLPLNFCVDQSNTLLCNANEVIQTKCTSCHEGFHNSWAAWNTDSEWLASGRITAGNPAGSTLVVRLKNYGTGLTNMPKDAGALTQEEYDKIEAWIDSL